MTNYTDQYQRLTKEFLPSVIHEGRTLFRRPQLEVVANARRARWSERVDI